MTKGIVKHGRLFGFRSGCFHDVFSSHINKLHVMPALGSLGSKGNYSNEDVPPVDHL